MHIVTSEGRDYTRDFMTNGIFIVLASAQYSVFQKVPTLAGSTGQSGNQTVLSHPIWKCHRKLSHRISRDNGYTCRLLLLVWAPLIPYSRFVLSGEILVPRGGFRIRRYRQ